MKRSIDFAIVGAHKCATTSLYHFLRQHVDIYLPEIEENSFFTKPEFYAEGDRFLVLLTDEIKANAAAAVRHTLAWLGIDPNGHKLDVSRRRMTAATPKSARLQKLLMARDTVYRRTARKMIPQRVRFVLQRRI